MLRRAAREAHVRLRQIEARTQSPDHPILPPGSNRNPQAPRQQRKEEGSNRSADPGDHVQTPGLHGSVSRHGHLRRISCNGRIGLACIHRPVRAHRPRTQGSDTHAGTAKLSLHRLRQRHHESLGRPVDIKMRIGEECGGGGDIQDLPVPLPHHVRADTSRCSSALRTAGSISTVSAALPAPALLTN